MRLRSVRMKNGGATVHVLNTPQPYEVNGKRENWRGKIISNAKAIADQGETGSELDGFLVIGMFSEGTTSIGFRIPKRIPSCLMPSYIEELVRRDVVMEREAIRVFDSKFEWVE